MTYFGLSLIDELIVVVGFFLSQTGRGLFFNALTKGKHKI